MPKEVVSRAIPLGTKFTCLVFGSLNCRASFPQGEGDTELISAIAARIFLVFFLLLACGRIYYLFRSAIQADGVMHA